MRKRLTLLAIAMCTVIYAGDLGLAQESRWSPPVQLSDTGRFSWFPDIAADPSGHVHVVWATFVPGYDAVMYATADRKGAWSRPTDIIVLSDTGAATRPTIMFDLRGNAHLIGRNDHQMVYYRVPFDDLQFPQRWPRERDIASPGAYFSAIASAPDGSLHFIFTANPRFEECITCYSIFYRQSRDGGASWSNPTLITPPGNGAVKPQLIVDRKGYLHVVWDAGRGGGLAQITGSTQVSYISSRDGGRTWSDPLEFSGPTAGYPDGSGKFITIAEDGTGKLVIAWLKLPDDVLQYQVSSDGGLSWSAPAPLHGAFGIWDVVESRLDTYSMATDSGGNVHLVMVGRLDKTSKIPSLLHFVWDGTSWSEPEVIFTSQDFIPAWPRIAIGLGNQLHVAWFAANDLFATDSPDADFRIWYSRSSASAPAIQPVVYPTSTPLLLPTVTPSTFVGEAKSPPVNSTPSEITSDVLKTEVDDYGLIILSIAPIVLLFVIGLLITRRRG
jgi:hypothetical protein